MFLPQIIFARSFIPNTKHAMPPLWFVPSPEHVCIKPCELSEGEFLWAIVLRFWNWNLNHKIWQTKLPIFKNMYLYVMPSFANIFIQNSEIKYPSKILMAWNTGWRDARCNQSLSLPTWCQRCWRSDYLPCLQQTKRSLVVLCFLLHIFHRICPLLHLTKLLICIPFFLLLKHSRIFYK